MPRTMARAAYADMYGPTTGDRVRLADTDLIIEVEKDFTTYGEEVKFGDGKVIRDGMGQSQTTNAGECFRKLLRDPFYCRVRCHIDPDQLSPRQPNNDQNVELDKAQRQHAGFRLVEERAQDPAAMLHRRAARLPGRDIQRAVQAVGRVAPNPHLGGLHHQYVRI